MTLDEIAYNILNIFRGGRSTHNEHISLPQIKFNVKHYRAMLLRRDFERNGFLSRHHEQDLHCLELELVDASMCCGLPADCIVSRTKLTLPKTVRLNRMDGITNVADITGINTIPIVDPIAVQSLPYDRFTKNTKKAYMIEDRMYIYNPDGMDHINVRGVFEDPEELGKFDCNGSDCYSDDTPFPLSADLIAALTDGLIKGTFQILPMSTSDTENDTIQDGSIPKAQTQKNAQRDQ